MASHKKKSTFFDQAFKPCIFYYSKWIKWINTRNAHIKNKTFSQIGSLTLLSCMTTMGYQSTKKNLQWKRIKRWLTWKKQKICQDLKFLEHFRDSKPFSHIYFVWISTFALFVFHSISIFSLSIFHVTFCSFNWFYLNEIEWMSVKRMTILDFYWVKAMHIEREVSVCKYYWIGFVSWKLDQSLLISFFDLNKNIPGN